MQAIPQRFSQMIVKISRHQLIDVVLAESLFLSYDHQAI